MDIRSEIEDWFPNIVGKNFKIFRIDGDFNCVSYTLDIYDGWMWTNTELWPYQKIPRDSGMDGFKRLYRLYGYVDCDNEHFEEGYDKIAFYSKNNFPIHACKQFGNMWRSKLGSSVIIDHKLGWLCGDTEWSYGEVNFIMKRIKR
jgi:hypothetical protein